MRCARLNSSSWLGWVWVVWVVCIVSRSRESVSMVSNRGCLWGMSRGILLLCEAEEEEELDLVARMAAPAMGSGVKGKKPDVLDTQSSNNSI
eukprot:15358881-Ditylum_brightwellii.AAC.2